MVKHCIEKCTGHCCMYYSLFVTDEDVKRIMKGTKLHPLNFLHLYNPNTERQGFYPKVCISSEWKVLGVKHNAVDLSCYFFMKNSGMCGINKVKPLVCRTYPFTLDEKDNVVHMKGTLCPVKWRPSKLKKVKKDILKLRKERNNYIRKVNYWNRHYYWHNFEKFIDYIIFDKHPTGYVKKKSIKQKIKNFFTI